MLLLSRRAGDLQIEGSISPFPSASSPINFLFPSLFPLLCVQGLSVAVLSALAEFRLAAGMPGMLGKLGTGQEPDLTFSLMCSTRRQRERKKRKTHELCGWTDR